MAYERDSIGCGPLHNSRVMRRCGKQSTSRWGGEMSLAWIRNTSSYKKVIARTATKCSKVFKVITTMKIASVGLLLLAKTHVQSFDKLPIIRA